MKVVCDNCRAVYKVPNAKLTKPVNKATCRNCGHRMLIPKPKPGADPDEHTLVTAVPPTPPGVDRREDRDDGPPTRPIGDEPEATLPGRGPSAYPGTPMPAGPRSGPSQATTITSPPPMAPPPTSQPPRAATPSPSQRRSTPLPAGRPSQVDTRPAYHDPGPGDPDDFAPQKTLPMAPRATPAPAQRGPAPLPHRNTPAPAPMHTPAPLAPAPAAPVEPQYDPSGDLAWAVVGTLVALLGAFVLASLTMVSDQMWRIGLSGIGLMLAIAGSLSALLILLTGGRGTRAARTGLSIFVSGGFSFVLSGLAVSTSMAAMTLLREAETIEFGAPPPRPAPVVQPTPTPEPVPDAAVADTTPPDPNDGTADAEAVVAPSPGPSPSPAPGPKPGPKPAPSPGPAPTQAPQPAPAPGPAPAPAPPPPPAPAPAPAGVPMDVVEVMLYNNLGVKKCFVPLFKAGNVPARVDIRFTIQPTGAVSAAGIQQGDLQGGDFESCMRTAVMGVTFPPFSGNPQTLTFPFVLNR